MTSSLRTDVLVVGSGAGGATVAARLAEAGLRVVVAEEGPWIDRAANAPFSEAEMVAAYRSGGLTATVGRTPIAYAEASCAGGGTEVNSGLYHRPPAELLDAWARGGVAGCSADDLAPYSERIEADLSISLLPGPAPRDSAILADGAAALGWQCAEVPRWFRYDVGPGGPVATKQTMTRTYLPQARESGAEVVTGCRVLSLEHDGRRVTGAVCRVQRNGAVERMRIEADHVVVAAGAIGTPALLLRSGIRHNVGRTLRVHPTGKVVAAFDGSLGDHRDVPVHQVKEFAPDLTLGGSASRPGHLALALADTWERSGPAMDEWPGLGVYYAAIRSEGVGRVRVIPGLDSPVVTYRLTAADMSRIARGLVHLTELLLAAGAHVVYPGAAGAAPIRTLDDVGSLWSAVRPDTVTLMTIHLFSSVPMGENRAHTGTDSYGRVWGFENLRVADASLLPDAPGVNPQGTIMAIAARNCDEFLKAG